MWRTFKFISILILFFESVVGQTYQMSGAYTQQPQITNLPSQKQALMGSLLTSHVAKTPMPERIDIIRSVLQSTPTRVGGRKNKRHELVELLKISAIQSLNMAANACKNLNEVKNVPVEYTMPLPFLNQVTVSRNVASDFPKTVTVQYI